MKKMIFSALALVVFGVSQAQEIKYGAKAGLNISNVSGDIENNKPLIGAHLGAFVEVKLTDKFAFQPELLFSMQGVKIDYSESAVDYSYSYKEDNKINYLNVPLMAKYFATEKLFLEAGPQIGFVLSAKSDIEETETFMGITDSFSGDVDIKDNLKSVDFGLNFGLGYEFTSQFFASARYNVGLTNINNASGSSADLKNGVVQFSFGYKF
ncbi:porin family protein [Flavobacterium cyclinae]|uniref:porin family protein n=1 Tax=Flavobacterium cyclinae TaxID=2895947 RepID=UPI001E3C86BE|nr:porin family protein [Flavobacterium cyclinae]UGS21864.1 PorT family protein [Flavobacterium cyclinae]